MALALANTASLKPEIRLAQAVSEFEASLSGDQKSRFRLFRSQAQFLAPQINDVMRITAEVDANASRKLAAARCYGPRFTNLLQTVQQFAALGDIIVGGSQNLVACGVWSLVRMTILAITTSTASIERLSVLFMSIGRSSPRYQALAVLYSRSRRIQDLLTRYFIVVVEICHHFVRFNSKSALSQITSSLNDSKLKSAEEDLHRWAQCIRDEANFLNAETTEREAQQNEDFRSWVGATSRSTIHCQNVEKRIHRLSLLSSFDYETPWKQIRKRGSASFPLGSANYIEWKRKKKPHTILLTGKMGSGKSVIMANIVDDLNLSQPNSLVLYFFCRRDNPDSLRARGIFSSFAKQVLQGHINNDTMDDIFEDFLPVPDFDKITKILTTALQRQNKTHQVCIVLDGFDECDDEEIELIKYGLIQAQSFCKIIISHRSQVNDPTTPRLNWDYSEMAVPEDNPDVKEFIDSELSRRIQSKTLSLGSAELVIDIRDALLRGAHGM
ncbi:putative NACHT domain protein [Rosellinia necatrix]|uniref:Putative NACHT domain protein n=1 Tax=Rosellinia necatrix TaxID=77044 RepID=A0A1S8A8H8_ROSNE|nr:putative NACHT domain protein [Rosellinia necatrix]